MWKRIGCGIVAAAGALLMLPRAGANKNFVPDWTFKGSSLGSAHTLGGADWRAGNGEIVGTPKTAEGGWLILDKPVQDVQFASTFRCSAGCRAGVMLRAQSTPEGIQGVYVALPDGENPAAAFAVKLDPQGREVKREPLKPGFGTVRFLTPPPEAAARGGRGPGGRAGGGRGFGPGSLPPNSPYTRPTYAYRPNEWNPLEMILDANYLRVWINDGPEGGSTNGQADEEIARYGPVALYAGGTGEVRFKQVELKDLGRRVTPDEQVSSRFRMQRINDFYYAWSAAVADVNHDGILDIIAGPFYYLGPDYKVSREIYPSQTSAVGTQYTPAAVAFAYRLYRGWLAGRADRQRQADVALRQPQRRTASMGQVQRSAHDQFGGRGLQRYRWRRQARRRISGRRHGQLGRAAIRRTRPLRGRCMPFPSRAMGWWHSTASAPATSTATAGWISSRLTGGGNSRRRERRQDRGPIIP